MLRQIVTTNHYDKLLQQIITTNHYDKSLQHILMKKDEIRRSNVFLEIYLCQYSTLFNNLTQKNRHNKKTEKRREKDETNMKKDKKRRKKDEKKMKKDAKKTRKKDEIQRIYMFS